MSASDIRALYYALGRRDAGEAVDPDGFVVYHRHYADGVELADAFEDYRNLYHVGWGALLHEGDDES